jgi:hypothetical protein
MVCISSMCVCVRARACVYVVCDVYLADGVDTSVRSRSQGAHSRSTNVYKHSHVTLRRFSRHPDTISFQFPIGSGPLLTVLEEEEAGGERMA